MLKKRAPIGTTLTQVYKTKSFAKPKTLLIPNNPFLSRRNGTRPLSAVIEDCSFGDSGKGAVIQKINHLLAAYSKDGTLFSVRYNGTRNAGHEIWVGDARIALHQLPVAVTQEKTISIMCRGMLIHPQDLLTEIDYVQEKLGRELPGKLWIDENTPLLTDLHAAFEAFTKEQLGAGKGSTASGVAPGYSDHYQKIGLTLREFLLPNWEEAFGNHYRYYAAMIGDKLKDMEVNALTIEGKRLKQHVGTEKEYLKRLGTYREQLTQYVRSVRTDLEHAWHNPKIPFTFEAAQGPGLDPYHGVYPDVTASRPLARVGIPDATEAVVMAEEIAVRVAVLKVPYMSIVGSKVPPYTMEEKLASKYRDENEETGRSTGRPRGIFPIDLVAMQYYQRAAQFNFVAITHMDSSRRDRKVALVTEYTKEKQPEPYRPYQYHWDSVAATIKTVPGWSGKLAAHAKKAKDLPNEAIQFIKLMNETLVPTLLATTGPKADDQLLFFKNEKRK